MAFLRTGDGGSGGGSTPATRFALSAPTGGSATFIGYGIYDPNARTVRIYAAGLGTNVTTTNGIVAEGIPSAYRPGAAVDVGGMWVQSGGGDMNVLPFVINTDGTIQINYSNKTYQKFNVIGEYTL